MMTDLPTKHAWKIEAQSRYFVSTMFWFVSKEQFLQEDNGLFLQFAIFRTLALKPGVFWAQVVQAKF